MQVAGAAHETISIAWELTITARKLFLAGATGAAGKRLIPLLLGAGYEVFGSTRSSAKAAELAALGVVPAVLDVFDAPELALQMTSIRPEIVVHQLTDLPHGLTPALMGEAVTLNARIRKEGTRNLVAAALGAGSRTLVAQSIAWAYAPGAEPHREDDPLDVAAEGARAITVAGVVALERAVLESPPLRGIVLRYGQFYGHGTGIEAAGGSSPLHIDAAASAVLLAIEKGEAGIYNVAEPNEKVSVEKARRELGWDAGFRIDV